MLKSKSVIGKKIICEYNSTNIKSAEYNTENKVLKITFNNDMIYEYYDVPHEIFSQLNLSSSTGRFFYNKIKNKFEYKKV